MRIGLLTAGEDCSGLNALIRAIVLAGSQPHRIDFIGFRNGWHGLQSADILSLDAPLVRGLSRQGGTILGSSHADPFDESFGGAERIRETLGKHDITALIAIGGERTLAAVGRLAREGIPIVGIPRTAENDLAYTDCALGFDTAVEIATQAIDRIRTTADSHRRCIVVEVKGRNSGWNALHSGLASGADAILIPEYPQSLDTIAGWASGSARNGGAPVIVMAEGFQLTDSLPALPTRGGSHAEALAFLIEGRTDIESRAVTLGFVQLGGAPSGFDRVLATRFGIAAVEAVRVSKWGTAVALRGKSIVHAPLDQFQARSLVPESCYAEACRMFG